MGIKILAFIQQRKKTPEGAIDSYEYTSEKDGVIYLITSAPADVTWDGNETWQVNVDGKNIDEKLYSKYFAKTIVQHDDSSQEKKYINLH